MQKPVKVEKYSSDGIAGESRKGGLPVAEIMKPLLFILSEDKRKREAQSEKVPS